MLTAFAEAGVRVRVVPLKKKRVWNTNAGDTGAWVEQLVEPESIWAPAWAVAIGANVAKLRKARKSTLHKHAAIAEAALLKR